MELITFETRNDIGIDTFERAIVFSGLLLRQGLRLAQLSTNQVLIYQNFGQSSEGKTTNITVEAKIKYESSNFLGYGGDFISTILPFSDAEILYEGDYLSPTIGSNIPQEPEEVYLLEQYFVWACTEWIKLNKQQNTTNWDSYGYFSFLEEASPPVFNIKIILPLDYVKFIDTKNLIASVIPVVNQSGNTYTSLIGNTQLFGNSYLVGN